MFGCWVLGDVVYVYVKENWAQDGPLWYSCCQAFRRGDGVPDSDCQCSVVKVVYHDFADVLGDIYSVEFHYEAIVPD